MAEGSPHNYGYSIDWILEVASQELKGGYLIGFRLQDLSIVGELIPQALSLGLPAGPDRQAEGNESTAASQ